MPKHKIAVSGDKGSFSEEAGLLYAKENDLPGELVYATDINGVLVALNAREADLGIFPVANSRGGIIEHAYEAMGKHNFKYLEQFKMDVEQCLMSRPEKSEKDIKKISSHPEAISHCENYLRKQYPNVRLIYWDDTAKAAKDLAEGVLSEDTAVIAPAVCAEQYGLKLLAKGIQDQNPNFLNFIVVQRI